MKPDFKNTFLLRLDAEVPDQQDRWGIFNAAHLETLDGNWKRIFKCEQGSRPGFLKIEASGMAVTARFDDDSAFDHAVVLASRNRKVNEANIIRAWNACRDGGQIMVVGDKTSGIGSLRKWVSGKAEIVDSFSKYHAVVFTFVKQGVEWEKPSLASEVDGYQLARGMFSSDGPDKGSRLLVEHFDKRIGGPVADLGAGWGYLSNELLKRTTKVTGLDLYEADFLSLEAAKTNVQAPANLDVAFHWCDITTEFRKKPYQWIIMNPPFHSGRAAEPELGKRFIQVAASTLPTGGKLLMVANRNLPYEKTLESTFRSFKTLDQAQGFKVLEASK